MSVTLSAAGKLSPVHIGTFILPLETHTRLSEAGRHPFLYFTERAQCEARRGAGPSISSLSLQVREPG